MTRSLTKSQSRNKFKRKSKSKQKSTSRSSRRYCREIFPNSLILINSIVWDINDHPTQALKNNEPLSLSDYHQELCLGRISLLLPVTIPQGMDTNILMYEQIIHKKIIRISDILMLIWKFYNSRKVTEQDLNNFNYVHSYQDLIQEIRDKKVTSYNLFKHFLRSNIVHFGGLNAEGGSNYRVILRPSF